MNQDELETLYKNVEDLKRAVRRNNPFLREILASRIWTFLIFFYGILIVAFCFGGRAIIRSYGSFAALPNDLKTAFWASLAFVLVAYSVAKFFVLSLRSNAVDKDAGVMAVIRAAYGGLGFHIFVPAFAGMIVASVFAVSIGHPWYIVPVYAVFYAFAFNGAGVLIEKAEYFAAGWYSFASGLASLFFLERDPFVWTAAIMGGMCFVYGLVALFMERGKKRRAQPVEGPER